MSLPKPPNICVQRRGIAAVEFAVILPVFLIILLGAIETCTMIFLQQSLEIAAYEAARVTLVPESDMADVNGAANHLLNARRVNGAVLTVMPADFANAPYGSFIRVDVSASCSQNSPMRLSYFSTRTLTGSVEFMKEY
jgi:Flp pilus assembly protein TadG